MTLFNNDSLFVVGSVIFIVGGIFTSYKYNVFTGVHIINKNLMINSLIVVTVVVILGVFIYTFYNITFTSIYCDSGVVSEHIMDNIWILEDLQKFVGVLNHYDITESRVFFNLICKNYVLDVEPVNGVLVNVFKINNALYTVDPDLVNMWIDMNVENF
jgi:hypothetical protein